MPSLPFGRFALTLLLSPAYTHSVFGCGKHLNFCDEKRYAWGPVAAPPRLCSPGCARSSGGAGRGVPRGYDPLVAGRSPRRGGRERSDRWKGEGEALPSPRRWGCPSAAPPLQDHDASLKLRCFLG